jgi:hypothetical protein
MKPIVRTSRFGAVALFSLALTTAACSESSIPGPSDFGPPPAPAPPLATFTVSGTVTEATESGEVPVEGVWVGNWMTDEGVLTDSNGSYSLSFRAGAAQLIIAKQGYEEELRDLMVRATCA